ncbi:hypothetical protein ACFL5E_01315 [Candidatus Omnitrophota bacterium]
MPNSIFVKIADVPIKLDSQTRECEGIIRSFLKDFICKETYPEERCFVVNLAPSRGLVKFGLSHDDEGRRNNTIGMTVGSGHIDKDARFAVAPDASDQSPEVGEFILDNFLRICFQYVIVRWNGIILHSSAVVDDGKAMVFIGPNSGGKSTISANTGCHVLSDDSVALRKMPGGEWTACATPWGKVSGKGCYPIEAMFFIKKSDRFYCEKVDPIDVVKGLFSNASLSFPDMEEFEPQIFDDILGIVTEMGVSVPVYEMGFRKDDNVVELLKKEQVLCS